MSTPKPISRLTEVKATAELIGSFLNVPDLGSLCQASKETCLIFSRNLRAMDLLNAVFDADPKKIEECFFGKTFREIGKIILTRTQGEETYFSKKLDETICKRRWKNISPLEAAAWCGDIFIVKTLLSYLPFSSRGIAAKQLQDILERKESAEHGEFLAPFKELIKAYENYVGRFEALAETDELRWNHYFYNRNQNYFVRTWNQVWEKQRMLPTYGLQEFCDVKPFFRGEHTNPKPPSFEEEPRRACVYWNSWDEHDEKGRLLCKKGFVPLDLEDMPKNHGIVKGGGTEVEHRGRRIDVGITIQKEHPISIEFGKIDMDAIKALCKVRRKNLISLIKELEGPISEREITIPPNKRRRLEELCEENFSKFWIEKEPKHRRKPISIDISKKPEENVIGYKVGYFWPKS